MFYSLDTTVLEFYNLIVYIYTHSKIKPCTNKGLNNPCSDINFT